MARNTKKKSKKKIADTRPVKKKTSPLTLEGIDYVDYKDVNLLRRFMSERAKIRSRRVTGNDRQQQAEVARAIKVAREMALLPYSVRQVTQRKGGRRGDRRRDGRSEERTPQEQPPETDEQAPQPDETAVPPATSPSASGPVPEPDSPAPEADQAAVGAADDGGES